jgi:rubrerythrin
MQQSHLPNEAKAIRFAVEREKDDLRFSEVIFFTFLALFHILLAGQIEAEL